MANVQGQVPNVLWDHAINGKDRETEWKQLSQVSEIATKVRLDVFWVGLDAARVGVVIVRLEKCVEPGNVVFGVACESQFCRVFDDSQENGVQDFNGRVSAKIMIP